MILAGGFQSGSVGSCDRRCVAARRRVRRPLALGQRNKARLLPKRRVFSVVSVLVRPSTRCSSVGLVVVLGLGLFVPPQLHATPARGRDRAANIVERALERHESSGEIAMRRVAEGARFVWLFCESWPCRSHASLRDENSMGSCDLFEGVIPANLETSLPLRAVPAARWHEQEVEEAASACGSTDLQITRRSLNRPSKTPNSGRALWR